MSDWKTTDTAPSACLNCGRVNRQASGRGTPKAGDLTVCIACGAVMQFGPGLELCGLSPEEVAAVEHNPELLSRLSLTVHVVHFIMRSRG